MGKDSNDTPTSFQVGGVIVQSLEPRRPADQQPRASEGDPSEETSIHALTSANKNEATEQDDTAEGAADAGDGNLSTQVTGAGKALRQDNEPVCSNLNQSSYYFRYLENQDEDLAEAKRAEERGFAYRYHPADVVLHSWGPTLGIAFQRAGLAMFNYMTDIELIQPKQVRTVAAHGSDLKSLLYSFLTELLNLYGEDYFMASEIHIESLDKNAFRIVAEARGEKFDSTRHSMGTEVKAITMHDMGIWQKNIVPGLSTCGDHDVEEHEKDKNVEVFVVVDI